MAKAILALASGDVFYGQSLGSSGVSTGELVFNTSMSGYQEILSDPSYAEQMVLLTYPHIGNTGTNQQDNEAKKVWAKGLIVKDCPDLYANWRTDLSLPDYLKRHGVVAITGVDTRAITNILREKGAQNACLMAGRIDVDEAIMKAKMAPSMKGLDLAKVVTTSNAYEWHDGLWPEYKSSENLFHVVAYDFGVKANILRHLAERGCKVTVVPATTPAKKVLAMKPDGVFLSNGPGDPAPCQYAIDATKVFLDKNLPIFGICLGHQILALAAGAEVKKMKFGHHGANHPVQCLQSKRVWVTSQNHGFAVDESTLPKELKVTHRSLFDNTIQGIKHDSKPAFGFQGHPEASPGPQEAVALFDDFISAMKKATNHRSPLNKSEKDIVEA